MGLKERLQLELKEAMRQRDVRRRETLRMVLSAIRLAEVEKGGPLTDAEIWNVIQKQIRMREETIEAAQKGGREDVVKEAEEEIAVLQAFLPQPLSDAELDALIREAIAEVGATSPKDMGKVMGWVMPKVRGRADGARVSQRVQEMLARMAEQGKQAV